MPVRSVRRRYLWIHTETPHEINYELLHKLIENKVHFLYGVKGAEEMNFRLIEYLFEDHDAIIRCNHSRLNEMRAALAHITSGNGDPIRIDVKRVSGTIKSLKKYIHPTRV